MASKDEVTTTAEDANQKKDALRDNIERKGKYSYYYGHATQDAIMAESGSAIKTMGGSPKLLERTVTPSESTLKKKGITSFTWLNSKRRVRIYIEEESLRGVKDEDIHHKHTHNSFSLSYESKGCKYVFDLPVLSKFISGASIKRKDDKTIVISLTKAAEETWYDLKQK